MDARTMRRHLMAAAQNLAITTEPSYDRSAGLWEWEWVDGPSPEAVAAALGTAAAERVVLRRRPSPRSAALAVIVEATTGTDSHAWLQRAAPTTAPDARTDALAQALAAAAPAYLGDDVHALDRHLREIGGPTALLHPYTGTHTTDAADPLALTALEHLTATYALSTVGYEAHEAWTRHLRTVADAPTLARVALADAAASRTTRLAAVAMLGALRAELEALEDQAMTAATEAGASYADLGRAMGVARQVAHRRHARRAAGHPTRASSQG